MAKKSKSDEDLGIQIAVLRTKVYEGIAKQLEIVVKGLSVLDERVDKQSTKIALIKQSLAVIQKRIDNWDEREQMITEAGRSADRKGKWAVVAAIISVIGAITAAVIALY